MNQGDARGNAPVLPRGGVRHVEHDTAPVPRANVRGFDHLPPRPPTYGQLKTWTQSFVVARNNAGGGAYTTHPVEVQAETPDPRLLATLSFGFRQDGQNTPPPGPYPSHSVLADLYVRTDSGIWVLTNHIFDATQGFLATFRAPWSYRWADTPGRIVASLNIPDLPGTGLAVNGDWWAIASWGLAPGAYIPDDELPRLFAACSLTMRTEPLIATQTGV